MLAAAAGLQLSSEFRMWQFARGSFCQDIHIRHCRDLQNRLNRLRMGVYAQFSEEDCHIGPLLSRIHEQTSSMLINRVWHHMLLIVRETTMQGIKRMLFRSLVC